MAERAADSPSELEVVYYVACSLDGYIATADGGVEWLAPFHGQGDDYGYAEFYSSVESLLMGSGTYEFALTQDPWPSPDKPSWVFTQRELPVAHPNVTLASDDPGQVVESLKARGLERAWLMGGGELAASFRTRGLISRYMIFVVPVLLGAGIPLFAPTTGSEALKLVDAKPHASGIVELNYVP
jgi:dihydrofolate reductase